MSDVTNITNELIKQSGLTKVEFASRLGISPQALHSRLKQTNIGASILTEMLNELGYDLVLKPRKTGKRPNGEILIS